jgi:hypothetical protein
MASTLVVICDFNLVCSILLPNEADPVLIVDSDAVLAGPVSLQRLQPIAWRNAKIREIVRGLDLIQLSKCHG